MRISYKILIINFVIVLLVLGSSVAAYYSVMYNVLATQQSKFLLNSANDFLYAYRENVASLEEEYLELSTHNQKITSADLNDKKIDFVLFTSPGSSSIENYSVKSKVFLSGPTTIEEFFYNNPYNITNIVKNKDGSFCYYGRILNTELLNEFSKRIRAEVAIIWKSSPSQISNEIINQKNIYALEQAYSRLSKKENFEYETQKAASSDLLVTIYTPSSEINISNIRFLIFSSLNATNELSSSLRDIVLIIGSSGVLLSIILTFLFTDKIRKRITDLSEATAVIKVGDFHNRLKVTSNDELGKLAGAFNAMLDELEKNQKLKDDYVSELKDLNEDFQKQNIQIRKQNETLLGLHSKIKEKADELIIQKERAEESTKLKSQFLASMSHELRTPMNSILGLSELILTDPMFKGKNRERLEVLLKSSKRLMTLINDILDLTKIESGKIEIREENFVLQDMLKEIEFSVSPLLLNKDIKFRLTKDINSNIVINTDRGKITQVLINLIGNAIKFTEKGSVEMHIKKIDNMLSFDIIDSGIGISADDQKIIFDEFRQVDGTISRKYSGTGLGLAICKRIADILNGTISVQSILGKGSTFTFSIPFKLIDEIKPDYNSKKTIQVIEADKELRFTIGDYLSGLGYDVVYSDDGECGFLDAIKHQPFLSVLDAKLPNKDGWDVIKYLKDDKRTKYIPVIMFSVWDDLNVGFGLNILEYLFEPFDNLQIRDIINKLESSQKNLIDKIFTINCNTDLEILVNEMENKERAVYYNNDFENAFSEIQEHKPSLIFINITPGNKNAIALLHKLKFSTETKHIPIVIVLPAVINTEYKEKLFKQMEAEAIASKTHPLDLLKIIRDRIRSEEVTAALLENRMLNDIHSGQDQGLFIDSINDKIGNILIIDDDPDTLFTINEILTSCNCRTFLAAGGREGLKILEKETPDLILLDIMMPEMDGFQTIKSIKQIPHLSEIPVFAVTAKAMLQDKDIILRNGFTDYIPKPINASMLNSKIRQALSNLKVT